MRRPLLALVLALPGVAVGLPSVTYVGEARAPDDGRLLYTEQHLLRQDGDRPVERRVMYRCPDGRAFARKEVDYGQPAFAPGFRIDDARFGYVEGYARDAAQVFVRRGTDAALQSDALDAGTDLVVDAGFDEFVRARWDALQSGRAVPLAFLVPSRLTSYRFSVRKLREDSLRGEPVSVFRLTLRGMLGWFVDGIDVSYRDRDRGLARFEGLSNIRASLDDNLIARIDFPARAEPADDSAWASTAAEPLHACTLGS
ncbi:MAG: hypothetical protein WCZ65_01200 [Lysobacteraceae bacterium]